jgi:sterol desaturase/sphingolipid hydroxylase (fatty acid hydroxylase superfamily)
MLTLLLMLGGAFIAYGVLARFFACNPGQRRFAGRDLADDVLYWFITVLFFSGASEAMLKWGAGVLFPGHAVTALGAIHAGFGWPSRLPIVLQVAAVLVVFDVIQYWVHRAFHDGALWPFHAIHHSGVDVDWNTAFRIHPVNYLVYSASVTAFVRLMGFSDAVFLAIAPFNFVISTFVHANLNWTFGPLRYVVASPVFHRWHHVRDPAVHNRNFAPTFPVLDLIFGTFYMPKGELPADFGVDGVPTHFLPQLIYPFAAVAERFGLVRKPATQPAA